MGRCGVRGSWSRFRKRPWACEFDHFQELKRRLTLASTMRRLREGSVRCAEGDEGLEVNWQGAADQRDPLKRCSILVITSSRHETADPPRVSERKVQPPPMIQSKKKKAIQSLSRMSATPSRSRRTHPQLTTVRSGQRERMLPSVQRKTFQPIRQ